jgi:hypothetical protein
MAEAELAAAAAEEHVAPENPYITLAKTMGNWAPKEHGDGHPDVIDLTTMNKPVEGFPNIEAMRQEACKISTSGAVTSLPEACRPHALKLIATAFNHHAGEELNGRARKTRRAVSEVIAAADKFKPGSDPRPMVRTPGKLVEGAKALFEEAQPRDALVQSFMNEITDALTGAFEAARKASEAKTQSPGVSDLISPDDAGSDFLRNVLQKYAKSKRPENTVQHFARFAAESVDKTAVAADTAAKKGEYQVAWELTQKGMAMRDELKKFVDLAQPIGFPQARDFFMSLGDPFVGITQANYDHAVGLAKNRQYRDIVSTLGDDFPRSAIKFNPSRKRERQPDRGFGYDGYGRRNNKGADSDSEGEPAPKRRGQGGRPYCNYCHNHGHTMDNCFKRNKGQSGKPHGEKK